MVFVSGLTFGFGEVYAVPVLAGCNELGEDEGAWVVLKGSKSRRNRSCLVYSFNNRRLLLQLRV